MIPDAQKRRWNKAFSEPFYVLESKCSPDRVTVKITGSKLDVYTVDFVPATRPHCDCPDVMAKVDNILCKHLCFVLFKCCGLGTDMYCRSLTATDLQLMSSKFASVLADPMLSRKDLVAKFSRFVGDVAVPRNIDDHCVVCFDAVKLKSHTTCLMCGNAVHEECFGRWTAAHRGNHDVCLFCRQHGMSRTGYVNLGSV